jgi:hypothetical protein
MISIEKVDNGFIIRIEEEEETAVFVAQKEYDSMNMALASVCKTLIGRWQDTSETFGIKLDISP